MKGSVLLAGHFKELFRCQVFVHYAPLLIISSFHCSSVSWIPYATYWRLDPLTIPTQFVQFMQFLQFLQFAQVLQFVQFVQRVQSTQSKQLEEFVQ